jgi:hypothetical protein
MAADVPRTTADTTTKIKLRAIIPKETSPLRATSHHAPVQRMVPDIVEIKIETVKIETINKDNAATATTAENPIRASLLKIKETETKNKEKETKVEGIQRSAETTTS